MCGSFFRSTLILLYLFMPAITFSQAVPVREEPLHKPVLSNKYIRLLDVWLRPGDTSLFHIHETPSVFCYLSNGRYISKTESENNWTVVNASAGQSWYRSFKNGRLIHQVANPFDTALHVTDIELLKGWKKKTLAPLPYKQLFTSDKVFSYQLTQNDIPLEVYSERGPMIIEIVSGEVILKRAKGKDKVKLRAGQYYFVEPRTLFSLEQVEKSDLLLLIFEIK